MTKQYKEDTVLIHGGQEIDSATGSRAVPIYQTTSYGFRDADHAANLFGLKEAGNIYTRLMNPTSDVFEKRVALLEKAQAGLAFASGHAAIAACIWNLCQSGDEFVSSTSLYGGTYNLFSHSLAHQGIKVNWAQQTDPESFRKAITPKTKAIFAETIGNPSMDVLDIEAVAQIAHEHKIPLIIDNTFAPYLAKPIEHGADIVIHSATKFIGGHGSSMGGIVVDAGNFDWTQGDFSLLNDPDPSYHNLRYSTDIGSLAFITRLRTQVIRDFGACLSPFNSFLFIQGLESLHLRMARHSENALAVAKFLENHPSVTWVNYPGLASNTNRNNILKYLPKGAGALLTFGIKGGLEAGKKFINALDLFSLVANVGDSKSLVIHPASTTHSQLSSQDRAAAGVPDELVRLSIGLEDSEDILSDLSQALKQANC
jgi:O-acetylhomoserine (thiol)-lyase